MPKQNKKANKRMPGIGERYKVTKKMEREMPVESGILKQLTPEEIKRVGKIKALTII